MATLGVLSAPAPAPAPAPVLSTGATGAPGTSNTGEPASAPATTEDAILEKYSDRLAELVSEKVATRMMSASMSLSMASTGTGSGAATSGSAAAAAAGTDKV